jgi:hypothetical protein
VRGDVPVNSVTLLIIDFVNLKIKPPQSFEVDRKGECLYVYEYLCLYCVSQKNMDPNSSLILYCGLL